MKNIYKLSFAIGIFLITLLNLISAENINNCTDIVTSGYYNLSQNINSSANCININSSNVMLECHGYTLNVTQRNRGIGIYAYNVNNVTIRNCNIVISNASATSAYKSAIGFRNVTNSTIYNNTISTFCRSGTGTLPCYGINITYSPGTINISYNTITSLQGSDSNQIRITISNKTIIDKNVLNCTAIANCFNVNTFVSYFNSITNNTLWGSGTGIGLNLNRFRNSNVSNNTITGLSVSGFAYANIYLTNSPNNNFTGNKLRHLAFPGFLYGTGDGVTNLVSNTIDQTNTFNGLPILLISNKDSYTLANQTSPYGQILVLNSTNINFYNVTINTTQNGISINFGINITIDSCNITSLFSPIRITNMTNSNIKNSKLDSRATRYSSSLALVGVHGNNNFTNLSMFSYSTSLSGYGITLSTSRYNQFNDITIYNSGASADLEQIYATTAVGNYFNDITINHTSTGTASASATYTIQFQSNSWDNIINNSNIISNGSQIITFYLGTGKNNLTIINSNITCVKNDTIAFGGTLQNSTMTFINTNWSELNISTKRPTLDNRKNMTIFNYNYLSINVTETTTHLPVNQANASVYFNNGTWVFNGTTGTDGFVYNIPVLEFIWNNSANWTYQLNYTINVTKDGFANYTGFSINISNNQRADINITSLTGGAEPDTSYPIFSNYLEYPLDPAEYSPDKLYNFSVTIINNNGTASMEFNGVNYTMFNVTDSFNRSLLNLGAGTYYYYYWAYGNGTDNNYNLSNTLDYTINKNSSYGLALSVTSPITYGATTDFTGSGCPPQLSCSLNLTNSVFPAGTISANYSTAGNSNYTAKSQVATVTINKATSSLGLTATTPITYGDTTDFLGSGCPSGATCSLNISNAVYGAGTISANYSFAGNQNYSGSSAVFTVTINKDSSNCQMLFNETSPLTYNTKIKAYANCGSAFVIYLNGTVIENNSEQNLGTGNWNFTVYRNDTQNYTNVLSTSIFTINKATTSLGITKTTPIMYPTATDFTGTGCNAQIVCSLNITNAIFQAGTISANYSTPGGQNYSGSSAVGTITINQNTTWDINLTASPSWEESEGTETTVNNSTACPSELLCKLYRNNVLVSNPDIQTLAVGIYNYTFNSTGNTNYSAKAISRLLNITSLPDSSPPTWINLRNISHNINTEFSESITASDPSGIDSYVLNDTTTFQINKNTGLITNKTSLMTLMRYNLNISVNDTLGNLASGIFYIEIITSTSGNGTTIGISLQQCKYKKFGYYNEKLLGFNKKLSFGLGGDEKITCT
jgi:hypothetical protein